MARKRRTGGRLYAPSKKIVHETSHETSLPTGRAAYVDTRKWLINRHGPICAYCGLKWPPRTITLDHVTPRKGQTAYDRRDNLVLACTRCNAAKADKPFLAFLFANKTRAKNLLKYGEHLSEGILEICRPIAGNVPPAPRVKYGKDADWENPYKD